MLPSVSLGSPLLLPRWKIGGGTSPSASTCSSTPTSCFNSSGPDCCCRRCYPSRCPVCSAPRSASVCFLVSAIAGTSCRCPPRSVVHRRRRLRTLFDPNFPLAVGMLRRDLPLSLGMDDRRRLLPSRRAVVERCLLVTHAWQRRQQVFRVDLRRGVLLEGVGDGGDFRRGHYPIAVPWLGDVVWWGC